MSPLAAALTTGFGLVLALAGVACGVVAYVQSLQEHDDQPVWPWGDRQLKRVWTLLSLGRDRRSDSGTATIALAGSGIGSGEAFGTSTLIRSDESIDERLVRLEARLQLLEKRAADEQARAQQAERDLEEQLSRQGRRLENADEQLRALAKAVAVSTARLQLSGLILVGTGTALMAVPTVVAAF